MTTVTQENKTSSLSSTSPLPRVSKNDIFNESFAIFKPAPKMSDEELESLKIPIHSIKDDPLLDNDLLKKTQDLQLNDVLETFPYISHTHPSSTTKIIYDNDTLMTDAAVQIHPYQPPESILIPNKKIILEGTRRESAENIVRTSQTKNLVKLPDELDIAFLPTKTNFLGEGRYSCVYKAQYMTPSAGKASEWLPCAVKRIHDTPDAQASGLSELLVLHCLSDIHVGFVKLIGVKDENNLESDELQKRLSFLKLETDFSHLNNIRLLVVLELCPNGDLWKWMIRNKDKIGHRLWMKWARQLASAVECMHSRGIIHHDIKPHNIMVRKVNTLFFILLFFILIVFKFLLPSFFLFLFFLTFLFLTFSINYSYSFSKKNKKQ